MASLLNICPVEIDLCISRGDTTPFTFTMLKADGTTPEDITGFSYLLTVNVLEEPGPSDSFLFQLSGTIPTGTDGVVQFQLSAAQADNLGDFFFDVQQTDGASDVRTVVKGAWEFKQDITK